MLNVQLNKAMAFNDYGRLTMNRYTKEGMKSLRKNKGKYINPYKSGCDKYNDFERGWSQALKRSFEHLLKEYRV